MKVNKETIPYTYLIGWPEHNKWYYGVRFANGCHPNDLWNPYKTSSGEIAKFVSEYGDPTHTEIRKTFNNIEDARRWEHIVLRRMKVIHRDDFLNLTDNISICPIAASKGSAGKIPWNKGKSIPRSKTSIEKQRDTITGKKRGKYNVNLSEERILQLKNQMIGNKINTGKIRSVEEKKKRSISGKGIYWWTDDEIEIKSRICPPGFNRGRLKKQKQTP